MQSRRPANRESAKARSRSRLTYYRSSSSDAKPSPFASRPKPKDHKRLFKVADIVALLLLVFCLAYSMVISPNVKVNASNYSYHNNQVYAQVVTAQFKSFTNRNKITFDEAKLVQYLQTEFPEVTDVRVDLPFFAQTPTVQLQISQPAFVLKSRGTDLVVDSHGTAVENRAALATSNQLPKVEDQSGYKVTIGQRVLSTESAQFIKAIINQAKKSGVPVQRLILPAKPLELDVYTGDGSYYTKFYLGGDAARQIGQFLAARHQFQLQPNTTPKEYLDVRVEGKIFYK